jgi:hypothetical protein
MRCHHTVKRQIEKKKKNQNDVLLWIQKERKKERKKNARHGLWFKTRLGERKEGRKEVRK